MLAIPGIARPKAKRLGTVPLRYGHNVDLLHPWACLKDCLVQEDVNRWSGNDGAVY